MIRIETSLKNNYGLPVLYIDGIRVTYDKKGTAEVTDEIGEKLLKHYPEFIFKAGAVPKPNAPKVEILPEQNDEKINELTNKLVAKEQAVKSLKGEIIVLKNTLEDWKKAYKGLDDELKALKNKEETPVVESSIEKVDESLEKVEEPEIEKVDTEGADNVTEKKTEDDVDPNAELKASLGEKNKADLQEMAQTLEKPRNEWGSLKKDDLIEYLIENTKE